MKNIRRQRRMFAIIEDRLRVAPEGDSRSHEDWLQDVYGVTEPQIHGYVDSRGVHFYGGDCRSYFRKLSFWLMISTSQRVYSNDVMIGMIDDFINGES